jgi:hypothetical protein
LQAKHLEAIALMGEEEVDQEAPMRRNNRKGLASKIEFRWRPDDAAILDQVRAAVDRAFLELYGDAITAIDMLYGELRVPVTNEEGVVEHDASGRVIWQKDSRNREIENWDQLTGQDLEKCLLDIAYIKLELAPQLNDLLLEAVFAKHVAEDAFADAYEKLVDDTIPARNAYASRESRVDKYHAFYRYYLYSHAEVFMKELNNFSRLLERIRYWRIDDGGKATP